MIQEFLQLGQGLFIILILAILLFRAGWEYSEWSLKKFNRELDEQDQRIRQRERDEKTKKE